MMRMFHEPSRGIGGETASPDRGTARRVDLPGRGKSSNITEDVRKYAAEQGIAEEEALAKGMAEKAEEYRRAGAGGIDSSQASPQGEDAGQYPNQFVEKGAEVYTKA